MLDLGFWRKYIRYTNLVPGMLGGMGMEPSIGCVEASVSVQLSDSAAIFPTRESAEPRVWRVGAACRDTDPDLFFPVGQTGPAIAHIANAKAVCETCEVQIECLEYALMTNQDAGIWGGLTEDDRRKIRRERRKANRAAQAAAAAEAKNA